MSKKSKFYVVWSGRTPGVYTSWEDCKAQTFGYEKAVYKSFPTKESAEKAFTENPYKHINRKTSKTNKSTTSAGNITNSLAVDAACSGNPGLMEYRGVYVPDGSEIFHVGPLEDGTNNIGEFLAIVHALALLKSKDPNLPIYSDSVNAIKWVEKKKCNTTLKPTAKNKKIFELIERAEVWLKTNSYSSPLLKWETKKWGEIPADFGRK